MAILHKKIALALLASIVIVLILFVGMFINVDYGVELQEVKIPKLAYMLLYEESSDDVVIQLIHSNPSLLTEKCTACFSPVETSPLIAALCLERDNLIIEMLKYENPIENIIQILEKYKMDSCLERLNILLKNNSSASNTTHNK